MKTLSALIIAVIITGCSSNDYKEPEEVKTKVNSCQCTREYNPVCGFNNHTYPNECIAQCNEVYNYTKGACLNK